ncbi:MAG TPA: hypothetical protein VM890_02985 [Longimicrobium sp.]|jgi:hypothetical protein|nr:hypothetical protein [Longimicrobium sp.]
MPTPLEKSLKRQVTVGGTVYTLTIDPEGLHLVQKGKRKGIDLTWEGIVGGDAALAVELRASLNRLNP